MTEVVKVLERVYQGFFLRDTLGFAAPGSISLVSLWLIFDSRNPLITSGVAGLWQGLSETWRVIAFLVAAYLLAWTLQSLHYGILNLIAKLPFFDRKFSELGPLVDSMNAEEIEKRLRQSPIVTRGALEPDLVLAKSMPEDVLKKELPYTERVSALFIMTGNLAIATFLLVLMLICTRNDYNWLWAAGFLIPFFLYIKHWRLWKARNLQVAIYSVEFKKRVEREKEKDTASAQARGGGGPEAASAADRSRGEQVRRDIMNWPITSGSTTGGPPAGDLPVSVVEEAIQNVERAFNETIRPNMDKAASADAPLAAMLVALATADYFGSYLVGKWEPGGKGFKEFVKKFLVQQGQPQRSYDAEGLYYALRNGLMHNFAMQAIPRESGAKLQTTVAYILQDRDSNLHLQQTGRYTYIHVATFLAHVCQAAIDYFKALKAVPPEPKLVNNFRARYQEAGYPR